MAPEWVGDVWAFSEYLGPRPSKLHSVDRINSNGNYEPGNVRWATAKEQARNMRTNRMLTAQGISKPLAQWVDDLKIRKDTILGRLKRGWSEEEALLAPVISKGGGSVRKAWNARRRDPSHKCECHLCDYHKKLFENLGGSR